MEARRAAGRGIHVNGAPVPLTVRDGNAYGIDRRVRIGDAVAFIGDRAPEEWDASYEAPTTWILEGTTGAGTHLRPRAVLTSQLPFRLGALSGNGCAYVSAVGDGELRDAPCRDATFFVMYKADMPDANLPSTCDTTLRDGDYVFVRAAAPSIWLAADAAGIISREPDVVRIRPRTGSARASRCHAIPDGDFVCALQPAIAASSELSMR